MNKVKVCIGGQVTRTALPILGKPESVPLLSPANSRITWVLRNEKKQAKDCRHFGPPLILVGDWLLQKILDLTVRHLLWNAFPQVLTQYDPWVFRGTVHNCIAYQDYTFGGRINVVETPHSINFY